MNQGRACTTMELAQNSQVSASKKVAHSSGTNVQPAAETFEFAHAHRCTWASMGY